MVITFSNQHLFLTDNNTFSSCFVFREKLLGRLLKNTALADIVSSNEERDSTTRVPVRGSTLYQE